MPESDHGITSATSLDQFVRTWADFESRRAPFLTEITDDILTVINKMLIVKLFQKLAWFLSGSLCIGLCKLKRG